MNAIGKCGRIPRDHNLLLVITNFKILRYVFLQPHYCVQSIGRKLDNRTGVVLGRFNKLGS